MVAWQNAPSTATPINAANLDAAFAEKADGAGTTAALVLKLDATAAASAYATIAEPIAVAAQTTANAAIPATQKGAASGVATLNSGGIVPAAQLPAAFADTGWITMTLLNGWVNFSTAYAPAAYRRMNGVTWITGVIKSGSSVAGQAIANLPVGFRPNGFIMRASMGPSGYPFALEIAGATGNLQQGAAGANPTWSILDMNFPADA